MKVFAKVETKGGAKIEDAVTERMQRNSQNHFLGGPSKDTSAGYFLLLLVVCCLFGFFVNFTFRLLIYRKRKQRMNG